MRHTKLLLVLVAMLGSLAGRAQNISTVPLRWTSDQTTDLKTSTSRSYASEFVTRGTDGVRWLQRNGSVATDFAVLGTEGSWTDVTADGTFTFLLARDGKTGKLIVQRSGSSLTLTLDFSESGEFNIKQQFRISTITAEP